MAGSKQTTSVNEKQLGYSVLMKEGHGEMRFTNGLVATFTLSDIDVINSHKWRVSIGSHGHAYVMTSVRGGRPIAMHRLLLGAGKGSFVDHADGDGLNNRRDNIRLCTQSQNMANKVLERRNKLGIKGVSAKGNRFRAIVTPNGRKIHLGYYKTKEEAAAAYKGAATILWGEFARFK